MLCNTSRTGLPAECHVFTIEPVFPSLLPHSGTVRTATLSFSWRASLVQSTYIRLDSIHTVPAFLLELTTDELMDLHREQQQEIMEDISSEEEEKKTEESLTSNEIREMCKMWETVQNFVEKHHPNTAVAVRAMNIFNDNQCHISVKS